MKKMIIGIVCAFVFGLILGSVSYSVALENKVPTVQDIINTYGLSLEDEPYCWLNPENNTKFLPNTRYDYTEARA
jgi:hypothetical protein